MADSRLTKERIDRLKHSLRAFYSYLQEHKGPLTDLARLILEAMRFEDAQVKPRFLAKRSQRASSEPQFGLYVDPTSFSHTAAFPAKELRALILEGCLLDRHHSRDFMPGHDINLLLALCLLAGTGIRKSELFHIWLEDVQDEVFLYHPSDGVRSKLRSTNITSRDILADQFGLIPRTEKSGAQHAGWKSLALCEPRLKRTRCYWISKEWRNLFYKVFSGYCDNVVPKKSKHPYLFSSLNDAQHGNPWTITAFNKSFSAALVRIGLRAAQHEGICPHGIRHHYGKTLGDLGTPPNIIKAAMHHRSLYSQGVYTGPSASEISAHLTEAQKTMDEK